MKSKVHKLDKIYPSLKGVLIASALSSFKRGVMKENTRLLNKTFVTIASLQDFDCDGLLRYFWILDGFDTVEKAVESLMEKAVERRSKALTESCSSDKFWIEKNSIAVDHEPRAKKTDGITCTCKINFSLTGCIFESRHYFFEVLKVETPHFITDDLFKYWDGYNDLTHYLVDCGEKKTSNRLSHSLL